MAKRKKGMTFIPYDYEAAYNKSLEDFLAEKVFCKVDSSTLAPDECDAAGFKAYLSRFTACLPVEEAAVGSMK